jgi:hypothetical protein
MGVEGSQQASEGITKSAKSLRNMQVRWIQFGECQEESENGLLALFEHEDTDWDCG